MSDNEGTRGTGIQMSWQVRHDVFNPVASRLRANCSILPGAILPTEGSQAPIRWKSCQSSLMSEVEQRSPRTFPEDYEHAMEQLKKAPAAAVVVVAFNHADF